MSIFIFLGPTLPLERAEDELPDAVFLPPARRGDIYRVIADHHATAVGLVDGLFDTVPAVAHKEILFGLSNGVRIFGAASMGALRAAELWQFGMEGVGRIFENYKTGVWEADDEVAVMHGPADTGFAATSVALANLRLGLEAAEESGVIDASTASSLIVAAADRFYADRSWEALYELGMTVGLPGPQIKALRAFVAAERPDAKRDDALSLLRRIRTLAAAGLPPHRPAFEFEETILWERIASESARVSMPHANEEPSTSKRGLRRHLQLRPQGREYLRGAVLLHLLQREARWRTDAMSQEQLDTSLNRFRRRHGLLSSADTRAWLAANELTERQLIALARLDYVLDEVVREAGRSVGALVPLELKRRGEFAEVAQVVRCKERALAEAGVPSLALEDVGISFEELMTWYQATFQSVEGTIDAHATDLGFDSLREFLSELLLEYQLRPAQTERIG